jgi:F-type H+-transporting ATPase subunit gamma
MPSLQNIKRRIRSVRGIRQITKAQQLVAASKLRRVQVAALAPHEYTKAADELLKRLSGVPEVRRFPLFQVRKPKHSLVIVVAGDRGMAGAYNSNILRAMGKHISEAGLPAKVITIGRRASVHVSHLSDVDHIASYDASASGVDVTVAQPVTEETIDLFLANEIDVAHVVYTSFVSTVKQEVTVAQLLPIEKPEETAKSTVTDFEPEAEDLIGVTARRVIEARILQAILDARASEEAARMLAMMNATDNAGDLIDDLTLAYNNARQANITQELAEISGGAEAITA